MGKHKSAYYEESCDTENWVLSFINNIKVYTVYNQFSAHKFHINESVTKMHAWFAGNELMISSSLRFETLKYVWNQKTMH